MRSRGRSCKSPLMSLGGTIFVLHSIRPDIDTMVADSPLPTPKDGFPLALWAMPLTAGQQCPHAAAGTRYGTICIRMLVHVKHPLTVRGSTMARGQAQGPLSRDVWGCMMYTHVCGPFVNPPQEEATVVSGRCPPPRRPRRLRPRHPRPWHPQSQDVGREFR